MKNVLSDRSLAQLSGFIAARMGLYFPPERWSDLERNITLAALEFKFTDPEAFIRWLPNAAVSGAQMEIIASHLTVNETYFWRETGVFAALTEKILPELIRLRQSGEKRLRIWSAGCSSGEEPYSIAIALQRTISDIKNWNITILATDLNPKILRKAAAGIYGQWSFRNAPSWLKENYFSRGTGETYEINTGIKKMAAFACLNLAEDVFPSPFNNTNAMDIIFCRNVLMYFVPERCRQTADSFHKSLVEGGYLIVSSSELSQTLFRRFCTVNFPGAVVYRKGGGKSPEPGVESYRI